MIPIMRAPLERILSPGPGRGFANRARLSAWDFYGRFKAAITARKEKPNPNPLRLWDNQPPIGKEAFTDPDFYRAHVLEAVLPFWERHGVDHRNGGFITHLDRQGAPYGRPIKNAAMMARLVLSFAQGFEISGRPAHLEMAENGFRFLVEKMWDPVHGGWLRDVAPDGVVESSEKRLFDQSYVLIGLAEFFRVSGSEKAREYIDRTFELLERRAWDPVFSGYYDSCFSDWRVKSDAKTLCTHLDMLTAALLLHDAAGESRCLDRARRLADLTTGMMDPGRGCVLERFTREWIYDPAPIRDRIQFGHNLKAAWLLLKLFRLTEHAPYLETARRLLAFCLDRGWDEPHGGFFQHAYRSGAPASRVKEWWPECEGMMALAWMHRITGDDRYKERFIRLAHFTFNAFWDRIHGEWVLACHPDGSVQNSVKGCAWKAAYHTVQACHEIWRLLEE